MIDAVHRYDGYVVQSTGDGIFALFGAPVAHEDHPQRALYAALRMQEELRRYSATAARGRAALPIEARVGVNTGEVVVRSIQTGEGTPSTRRSVIRPIWRRGCRRWRRPARSRSAKQTRKLVRRLFRAASALGPTEVKGVSEPVNVYEVTGLGPLRTRLAARRAARADASSSGASANLSRCGARSNWRSAGHGQIVAAMARGGGRQVAAVLRVQGDVASRLHGAGSLLGLARQGLGLPAGDRTAARAISRSPDDDERAAAREGHRQGR